MELFEAIKKRSSVRKYLDTAVTQHDICLILEAGRNSPSSGNLQPWKFIVVKDNVKKEELAESCYNQLWMSKAPVYIVITAESDKVTQFYGIRGERLYAIQNCAVAIQNMMLAATSLGLGTCWIGYFDEERIRAICSIPDSSRPQAILTLGYPAEEEFTEKKSLDCLVFFEKYGNKVAPNQEIEFKEVAKDFGKTIEKYTKPHTEKIKKHIENLHKKIKEHTSKLTKKLKRN